MFSLIIGIIAIALTAALTGATLYYGGDAFTEGSEKATVTTYLNQAQQIAAGVTMAKAENNIASITTVADLATEGYLSVAPASPGGAWTYDTAAIPGPAVTAPVDTESLCNRIIADAASSGGPFTCVAADPVTDGGTFTFTL